MEHIWTTFHLAAPADDRARDRHQGRRRLAVPRHPVGNDHRRGWKSLLSRSSSLSDLIADTLADGWNIRIMLFTILLGLMVGLLSKSGAAYSLGDWAGKKIKSRTGALIFTWVFGLFIFFDDYFNSLTIGTCMRPLTDAKKISRAKLAYILDSTAAPVAILAPISGWVAFVIGTYKAMPEWQSLGVGEFTFFLKSIPFNLYAIFAVFMVLFITLTHKDFGPMARSEARAEQGPGTL